MGQITLSLVLDFLTTGIAAVSGAVSLFSVGYLLMLLIAGSARRRSVAAVSTDKLPRVAIIIPAHNEEPVIRATLASVVALDYPRNLVETVVIADNCTDTTASIALAAGARVLERSNLAERGKGFALSFAMNCLLKDTEPADVFVIVDADTWVAPDFLQVIAAQTVARVDSAGHCALQGRYGVLNSQDGWRAALMAGAFDLFNHVKPMGRDALGWSVGLKGNGMAFTRSVLQLAPFRGDSITEDIDYGIDLLLRYGIRVGYAPSALVRAQMPVSADQAKSQRARWEGGRYRLMRERVPVLLKSATTSRDIRKLDAAIDLLLPPLAELAAIVLVFTLVTSVGIATGHLSGPPLMWVSLVGATCIGMGAYVLGGFRVAGAPPAAYQALLRAPGYVLWKFLQYAAKLFGRNPQKAARTHSEWVRTERMSIPTPVSPTSKDEVEVAP